MQRWLHHTTRGRSVEAGSRGHCSQETYTGSGPSSEVLEFGNGYSRKFAILLLEMNKSPGVFIGPKVSTCVTSINEIYC